jgi:hypothetical protein
MIMIYRGSVNDTRSNPLEWSVTRIGYHIFTASETEAWFEWSWSKDCCESECDLADDT